MPPLSIGDHFARLTGAKILDEEFSWKKCSIRDGYQHSRRTNQFYPLADLPRRKSQADYAVMLGSLSSVKVSQNT